jgi:hypothetical protein
MAAGCGSLAGYPTATLTSTYRSSGRRWRKPAASMRRVPISLRGGTEDANLLRHNGRWAGLIRRVKWATRVPVATFSRSAIGSKPACDAGRFGDPCNLADNNALPLWVLTQFEIVPFGRRGLWSVSRRHGRLYRPDMQKERRDPRVLQCRFGLGQFHAGARFAKAFDDQPGLDDEVDPPGTNDYWPRAGLIVDADARDSAAPRPRLMRLGSTLGRSTGAQATAAWGSSPAKISSLPSPWPAVRAGVRRDRDEPAAQYGSSPDSPLERDGFETSVPGESAYGLNLCLSPYELSFFGAGATPVCTAVVEDHLPCGQFMRMGSRPSQFSEASRT